MIEFLQANLSNFLVGGFVALLVFLAAARLVRDRKRGKTACGSCCSGCALAGTCGSVEKKE